MRKLNKKGKVILTFLFFLLATPMLAFYVAEESGFFDSRSRAGEAEIPVRLKFANLDGDAKIGMGDFGVWLRDYRAYKNNNSHYNSRSDFDEDKAINLSDFAMWVSAFREYKALGDSSRAKIATKAATGECRSFVLHAEITDDGGSDVLAKGFVYSKELDKPTLGDVDSGKAEKVYVAKEAEFKKALGQDKLAASTRYYYRAFVRNAIGLSYGETKEFTTSVPVAETKSFTISEGLIVDLFGRANGCDLGVKDKGFVYSTTKSGDAGLKMGEDGVQSVSKGEGAAPQYTAQLKGLAQGKKFYYRAYAINNNGLVSYGKIDEFKTETIYATTYDATKVWQYSGTLNGRTVGTDPDIISTRGFVYSLNQSTTTGLKIGNGGVTNIEVGGTAKRGDYYLELKDLLKGKKYYFRAYVKSTAGRIFYGDVKNFTTKSLVVLTTKSVTGIKKTSATLHATIGSSASPIKRIGFVYSSTNTTPTLSGNNVTVRNRCVGATNCEPLEGTDIQTTPGGLVSGTKYYVRVFAQNDDGVSFGAVKTFTTL
jgi:hypothetical protein